MGLPYRAMAVVPDELDAAQLSFLEERHLASLTLVDASGVPHVTAVGFTWDDAANTARVITFAGAKKVRLLERSGASGLRAVLCQIDGGRWLALHGAATVSSEPSICADAERRYAERYRPPGDRGADRRVIEITVTHIVGRA